jgi:hemoglobin/transferrin/lactoferrin receptor protein
VSPKFGATYRLTDGLFGAVSYGEGFRAPVFQELFPEGVHFAFPTPPFFFLALFEPNLELLPERSRGWDAGVRWSSGALRARVAYWESHVKDFIDLLPVATFPPSRGLILQLWQSINCQDAVLRGFEASADWQLEANWVVRAAYSTASGQDRASGEALLQIPPSKLILGIDWHEPMAGVDISWATRVYGARKEVPVGVDSTDGYILHDLHARWRPRFLARVSLFASLNNLANTEYMDPRFGTPGIARDVRVGFGVDF